MKHIKRGFTLVELMISVAIVGILAAIAIPNFIRFQARTKQAEAKMNLKAIFTGQKSRFAERDSYAFKIAEIGFAPERGNRYLYDLGNSTGNGTCADGDLENRTTSVGTAGAIGCGVQADIYRFGNEFTTANLVQLTGAGTVVLSSTNPTLTLVNPTLISVGVFTSAGCPLCGFTAAARGNIDNDTGDDGFIITSEFMSVSASGCEDKSLNDSPGSPIDIRNDIGCP